MGDERTPLTMTNINRQPAGQPTGGQFAESARAGAGVSLQDKGPTRFHPLNDSVHPDNLRVQAMLDLAKWRSGTGDWMENFPETIRSRWMHHIDPEDHFEDTVGPAMRAIEDGRTEDAT